MKTDANNKITLIQPWIPDRNYIPNLGILYIAGVLERAGYLVQFLDENLEHNYSEQLISFAICCISLSESTSPFRKTAS